MDLNVPNNPLTTSQPLFVVMEDLNDIFNLEKVSHETTTYFRIEKFLNDIAN